ncbi:uncharacterized protein EV422DRAFT_214915 [Fimicolochytrium jonesii]|uniref:uncharacterized protein n=1 Tax=Fimicolochytrium jonesii TaxID=1396493 RepID=UPI0022FEA323|nr:uncharacterized protein EV422DRAFT_214915 [Fimicolochytrium jonesii]KAI8817752.1 hypothetical protein EV422DRAFT_214915 [Fimicolochytrium jonesii]
MAENESDVFQYERQNLSPPSHPLIQHNILTPPQPTSQLPPFVYQRKAGRKKDRDYQSKHSAGRRQTYDMRAGTFRQRMAHIPTHRTPPSSLLPLIPPRPMHSASSLLPLPSSDGFIKTVKCLWCVHAEPLQRICGGTRLQAATTPHSRIFKDGAAWPDTTQYAGFPWLSFLLSPRRRHNFFVFYQLSTTTIFFFLLRPCIYPATLPLLHVGFTSIYVAIYAFTLQRIVHL